MSTPRRGFSVVELLTVLVITIVVGAMVFRLFHQNERLVRDQTLIMEMQQTARVVVSQIADEIRMAGQGMPLRASNFDAAASEAAAVILASSNASRIDFRAALSNIETVGTSSLPIDFSLGTSRMLSVADGSAFSNTLGTTTPTGKFVYVSEPWIWMRAEITSISPTMLTVTPRQTGETAGAIRVAAPPTVSLEEAVSIYLSGDSVRRATATDMTNPADPSWSAGNEIGKNVTALTFTYYDASGKAVIPASLANRISIARVDIHLTVEAAAAISDGSRPSYSLALRTIPRNVKLRLGY